MFTRHLLSLALSLAAVLALPAAPARAQPLDDIVTLEVLEGWRRADGRHVAALRLDLAEGWKTYWRAPGDSGIPPLLVLRPGGNVTAARPHWPIPKVWRDDGVRTIGYTGQVIVPLVIDPETTGKPLRLRGRLGIGVCDSVCVPVDLGFDVVLRAGQTQPDPTIAAVMADKPYSGAEAGLRDLRCRLVMRSSGDVGFEAEMHLPVTGKTEEAVVETGDPMIWVAEPDLTRTGDRIALSTTLSHMSGGPIVLTRDMIRITVLGSRRAVDIQGCELR